MPKPQPITRTQVQTALERALQIKLEAEKPPEGLFTSNEFASAAGLSKSSALRRLESLVAAGKLSKKTLTFQGRKQFFFGDPIETR